MSDRKVCSIEGCGRLYRARGFCGMHWKRWRRHGDPLAGRATYGEAIEFIKNVALKFESDDCLPWPFTSVRGYGSIRFNGKNTPATRVTCFLAHGCPEDEKLQAAHSCGNGHLACVNPRHLSWKTRAENEADKISHGTHLRGERQWSAKLTEKKVRAIRSLDGIKTKKDIAKQFGITPSYVYRVQTRHAWAWLD